MKRFLAAAVLIFLGGCAHLQGIAGHPADGTRVAIYLQPLSQEADRLRFSLAGVAAVREDGTEVPLRIELSEVQGADEHRQRLLAEGVVPSGTYTGFTVRAAKGWIATEEGEASLHILPEPAMVPFRFEAAKGAPVFVPVALRYRDAVRDNFSFSPLFSAVPAGRQVAGLTGYVSNTEADTLTVFDRESLQVTGLIGTGRLPRGVVFDQQGRRGYVALSGDDAVDIVDTVSARRVGRVLLAPGDAPREVLLLSDGRQLLSVNEGTSTVSFVDTGAMTETARVPVGEGPVSAVVDPTGRRAFVFCAAGGTVSVIDLARKSLITSVSVDPEPLRGAFSREGDSLTIIHSGSAYVTILDPRSLAVTARRYFGNGLRTIMTDTATGFFYVSRRNAGRLEIVDPVSLLAVDAVETGGDDPVYLAIDGQQNRIFVLGGEKGELLVLDGVAKKRITALDAGAGSYAVAVTGER